jgi:peroxiredoxin
MKLTTTPLPLALALMLAACGKPSADEAATQEPKPKAEAPETQPEAQPEDAPAARPDGTPEGYEGHLVAALLELAADKPVARAEPKPYGCSVKYADEGGELQAKIGEPAPSFSLPDLDGEQVSLSDFSGKIVVLEWFNPDCPFVKHAYTDGPLARLSGEQRKAGVVWVAINSGAPGKQGAGVERNKQARDEWSIEHPILIDESGEVGHRYGAKTTPHMFVIDSAGTLVYAGGLDNAPLGRVD